MTPSRPVLLYDATCRFCRFAARVAARYGGIALLPLQDPSAEPYLANLADEERLASWRLARRDGSLVGYLWIRGRIPDAVYLTLAGHRGLLSRVTPDGPAPRRFP